jgi:hypothetical protein
MVWGKYSGTVQDSLERLATFSVYKLIEKLNKRTKEKSLK